MKKYLVLVVLCISTAAFAGWFSSSKPEATTEASSGSSMSHTRHELLLNFSEYGLNVIRFGGGSAALGFGGGYNYRLIPLLQLGVRLGVTHASVSLGDTGFGANASASGTGFLFLGGGSLNFPTDWKFQDQFFGGLYMGIVHASVGSFSRTPFVFQIEVGKRFQVFPNLCWRPMFTLSIPTSGSVIGSVHLLSIAATF